MSMNPGSAPDNTLIVKEVEAMFRGWSATIYQTTRRSGSGMLRFDYGPRLAEIVVSDGAFISGWIDGEKVMSMEELSTLIGAS